MKILIVGVSARAVAESAMRSGYHVVTLDAFGDLDLQALCECYSLRRDFHTRFSAAALFTHSRRLDFDAVAYTSNLENHPETIRRFAHAHPVIGNSAEVATRVRDCWSLFGLLGRAGFAVPETICDADVKRADSGRKWLRKPFQSGGGHGITLWHPKGSMGPGFILQEYVPGMTCSASFVANGRDCVILGLTEQLIGQTQFGARGFRYCGNILPLLPARNPATGRAILGQVKGITKMVTRKFGLTGVNGLDFILRGDQPWVTEVNPRYSASMELIERAYGLPIFDLHVRAVLEGKLPEFDLGPRLVDGPFCGKTILFSEKDANAPDTRSWIAEGIRDVPLPGEHLARGSPICTLLASAPTREGCLDGLTSQAETVKGEIYG